MPRVIHAICASRHSRSVLSFKGAVGTNAAKHFEYGRFSTSIHFISVYDVIEILRHFASNTAAGEVVRLKRYLNSHKARETRVLT